MKIPPSFPPTPTLSGTINSVERVPVSPSIVPVSSTPTEVLPSAAPVATGTTRLSEVPVVTNETVTSGSNPAPVHHPQPTAETAQSALTRQQHDPTANQLQQRLFAAIPEHRSQVEAGADTGLGRMGRVTPGEHSEPRTPTRAIRPEEWRDPARIVGQLTQLPAAAEPRGSGPARCGPSALLGASLMNGPVAGGYFLERAALRPDLPETSRQRLREIASHLQTQPPRTSFAELSEAQGLLYQAGNTRSAVGPIFQDIIQMRVQQYQRISANPLATAEQRQTAANALIEANQMWEQHGMRLARGEEMTPAQQQGLASYLHRSAGIELPLVRHVDPEHPDGSRMQWSFDLGQRSGQSLDGLDAIELRNLAGTGGAGVMQRSLGEFGDRPLRQLLSELQPGQAATLPVAWNASQDYPGHFVTVGRTASGQPYLYNTYPSPGDSVLVTGSDVDRELGRYDSFASEGRLRRMQAQIMPNGSTIRDTPMVTIYRPQ